MARLNLPTHASLVRLTVDEKREAIKEVAKEKIGDRLLVFILGTVLVPLVISIVGSISAVQALKSSDVYLFNIAVLFTGVGEMQNRSNHLHRRTVTVQWFIILAIVLLAVFWVLSNKPDAPPILTSLLASIGGIVLSAALAGVGVYFAMLRDAYEEVNAWSL